MPRPGPALKTAGRLWVLALVVCVALWLLGAFFRPSLPRKAQRFDPRAAAAAQAARAALPPPGGPATPFRPGPVAPKNEAPVLHEMVAAGQLPPVNERLPADPAVLEGPDGIGAYGGTWRRLAVSAGDVYIIADRLSSAFLVRWSPMGYPIEPLLAKSVDASPDRRVWTIRLRPGTRWSDGQPFTADDILYWWNDEQLNPTLSGGAPSWMTAQGKPATLVKLDGYTVRISFAAPYALFLEALASHYDIANSPAHYLRPFHPDPAIGDAKLIAQNMKAYNLPSQRALYSFLKGSQNPDHPRMWPWVYKTYRANSPQVFVRNPYYPVVDSAGNQLPYLDRLQFDVQDQQILTISTANGGATMQDRNVGFENYTELMSRRAAAGTRVLHWYPGCRSAWVINPNLNRRTDPRDPSTKWKAQLLADKRFRQALSLALDRKTIIRAEFYGVGEPSQVSPGPLSPFDNPDLAKAYTQYEPARAEKLLDDLNLTRRDSEGYRTNPDGTRLTLFLDYCPFTGPGPVQFVVDDWARVGLRVVQRFRDRGLFYAAKDALDFDMAVWSSESDTMPLLSPRYFVPGDGDTFYAPAWDRWFARGGWFGDPRATRGDGFPPPPGSPMLESMKYYVEALASPDTARQIQLFRKIQEIAAENVWSINIATAPPSLAVIDARLRNVPEHAVSGHLFLTPGNTAIETYFFQNATADPSANAAVQRALLHPTPLPRPGETPTAAHAASPLPRRLLLGLIAVLLLAMAYRYPFIARRLAVMVPTLLIISVIVFTVIQLPPGDFLTSRIQELQASGDQTDLAQVRELQKTFHVGDPMWKNYARWMGFTHLFTHDPSDQGLLEGNLGRSMETQQPVNDVVGDRIVLTVLISLGTILFSWVLALPIGVYSAVKPYTTSDYALTLLGFIGMSLPAFLLALVLTAWSGLSGLFSPAFATQPGWDWPKVLDLLKHLWIPIIVLGVGGTAGLIRVMRANLLDELKKPYVVTARAKGVRPLRLLIKYPVRIALNPFVSGIGGLFPALISGGAIVSIVLALPTVGPLLLSSLIGQDTYLAASMLMVLSVLGVLGNLVSDVLLVWLDPRIRFEGGTR